MFVVNLPNVYLLVSHNAGLSVISYCRKQGAIESQKIFTSWSITCVLLV